MFYIRGIDTDCKVANLSGSPGALTTTFTGTGSDFSGTDDVFAVILDVGTVSGTGSPTLTPTVQESVDNSTNWTACSPCGAGFTAVVTSTTMQIQTFLRSKSYIRLIGAVAGNSPSFATDAVAIGQLKKV
jgi:hypothetical protein